MYNLVQLYDPEPGTVAFRVRWMMNRKLHTALIPCNELDSGSFKGKVENGSHILFATLISNRTYFLADLSCLVWFAHFIKLLWILIDPAIHSSNVYLIPLCIRHGAMYQEIENGLDLILLLDAFPSTSSLQVDITQPMALPSLTTMFLRMHT